MTRHCSNHPDHPPPSHTPAHHFTITKPWRFYLLLYIYIMQKCSQAPAFIRWKDLKTTNSLVQKKRATLPFFTAGNSDHLSLLGKGCVAATLIWDHIRRFLCPRNTVIIIHYTKMLWLGGLYNSTSACISLSGTFSHVIMWAASHALATLMHCCGQSPRKCTYKTWFVGRIVKYVVGSRCLHQRWPFVLQDTVHWIITDGLVTAASQHLRFIQSEPPVCVPKSTRGTAEF